MVNATSFERPGTIENTARRKIKTTKFVSHAPRRFSQLVLGLGNGSGSAEDDAAVTDTISTIL